MGLILAGLTGALQGGGEGGAKAAELGIKEDATLEHERLKQQLEGERETRNAQLKSQLTIGEKAAEPRVVQPGATLKTPGQPDFQAPDTKHPKELLDKFAAEGREADARAKALVAALKVKDLPASVKVYVDTLGKSLSALDKEEAGGMLDEKGKAALNQRRAEISTQLIQTLSTGQLPGVAAAAPSNDPLGLRKDLPEPNPQPAPKPAPAGKPTPFPQPAGPMTFDALRESEADRLKRTWGR